MADIQAGIRILADVEGAEQIQALAQQIDGAGLSAEGLAEEAQKLQETFARAAQQQALIDNYKALTKELEETGTAMQAADTLLDGLHESMRDGATAEQKDAVAKLRAEMERLAQKETELAGKVRDARNEMVASGVSVKNLAEHEKQLAQESTAAAERLDQLAAEANGLKAIADARIQLGLDADDKARQEIEKTKEAYETLKNSGTLSHQELERAGELQRQKIEQIEAQLQKARPSIQQVAGELQGLVTKAGGLAYAGREAVKFESAMAGVKKVVEGTPEEIASLSREIKKMAGELGIVPDQLAEIAAQGGQLGIALGELPKFTEMAAKMSVAFGMTAQEAGDAAATIANVFQLPISEVERLGDAINVLGNNTAARERDIVAAMARIGGTANQFGIAAEEAAALADAFIALGKPPEVAGTAINAMLQKLQTAQSQGKAFQDALGQIGLSADQLAADIAAKPQQALTDFLKRLEALDKQSRALVLSDLFGTQWSDDVALLVGSLGEYDKALALVADKTKTAGAMQEEFGNAIDTAEGRINQAKASFQAAAATIGEALLPAISAVASGAAKVADMVGKVAEEFPVLTQLGVMYASLRVGMQALEIATRLTGATSVKSMLQAEVGTKKFKTELTAAKAAAAALNAELAKGDVRKIDALATAAVGLKNKLAGAASAAAGIGMALSTGMSLGEWAYESFAPVRAVGDELGRVLAYVDAVFSDRTFEDVNKFYKTSAESKLAAAEAEKELEKARVAREEADKQAADAESARISAMQQQYRTLKAEHDSVAASMRVLQSEGMANGAAYADLAAKSEELQAALEKLNAELNKANADFKFDTGAVAEAQAALKDLGLTAEQVAGGISEGAQKSLDAFDKAALQFGQNSEQMARVFQAALSKMDSPEAVAALKQRLEEVGKKAGLTAEEIAKIGDTAPAAANRVAEAFAKIGVDAEAAATGISSKAKQAFDDWRAASAAAREEGIEDTRLIRQGFEQMMGTLKSRAEFEAFRQQLEQSGDAAKLTKEQLQRLNDAAKDGAGAAKSAYDGLTESVKKAADAASLQNFAAQAQAAFEAGTITAAQYDQVLEQVKQRTEQLAVQAERSGEKAAAAHRKAAQEADKHGEAVKKTAESHKGLSEEIGKTGAASESAARKTEALHQGISSTYGVVKLTREEFVRYNNLLNSMTDGNSFFLRSGWRAYADQFLDAIRNANAAQEELNAAMSAGTVNTGHLTRAVTAAAQATGKLDDASLKNLRASIESARQKLVELKNEATDARLAIEAELAALNGNEEMKYALEQQRKIEELRAKQQQAAQSGQSDAAAEWERALKAQEQLYAKQKQQRAEAKAEQQRQEREAAAASITNLNIGGAGDVDLSSLNGAANGVIQQLQTALNNRDAQIVERAGAELLAQLQKGINGIS